LNTVGDAGGCGKLNRMADTGFGVLLRGWRAARRLSQLDLSLDSGISTRHLSCLETGRAQPSRQMVVRLAEALDVPLRERNALLLGAGYAPLYPHTGFDGPEAEGARHAVELLMAQLEPYPVLIVDRYWNMLRTNSGARRFFALFPGCDWASVPNAVRLVFDPKGLRPFIENWENVASRIIQRVHREVAANPSDNTMRCFLDDLLSYRGVPDRWRLPDWDGGAPPFLTIDYKWKDSTLRLFSALTTFGTALDVALQELRIESFFPADETTRTVLTA